jgi:hypothetical protein
VIKEEDTGLYTHCKWSFHQVLDDLNSSSDKPQSKGAMQQGGFLYYKGLIQETNAAQCIKEG